MNVDLTRGDDVAGMGLHWWGLLFRGVVAVIFGLLCVIWPGISLAIVLALFGVYVLVDGVVSIISAVSHTDRRYWWLLLLIGVVGITAGIITFAYPIVTMMALLVIIGVWAVVTGVLQIITAFAEHATMGIRLLWGIGGLISLIFGVLLFVYPLAGLLAVVWLIGFYAMIFGISQVVLGLHLHEMAHAPGMRGVLQH